MYHIFPIYGCSVSNWLFLYIYTMDNIQLLKITQFSIHYGLHFIAPGLIAWFFFRDNWKQAWLIMAATILVDIDHLLANPIFDPRRCSIGFHPLHTWPAMLLYTFMLFFPKTRIVGVGLLFHMLTDCQDCMWNSYILSLKN
jgi:hypothetical protein